MTATTAPVSDRSTLRAVPDSPPAPELPDLLAELRRAGERLLTAVVNRLAEVASEQVDDLADGLERMTADAGAGPGIGAEGGVGAGAAAGAGRALLQGGSVVWGAVKGGFAALGTAAKILIGLVLVLAPVLLILSLVVLIVAGLVWAVVAAVRAVTS